jgi:hypothetical protein
MEEMGSSSFTEEIRIMLILCEALCFLAQKSLKNSVDLSNQAKCINLIALKVKWVNKIFGLAFRSI